MCCVQYQTVQCETDLMNAANRRIELYHHLLGKQWVVVELQQYVQDRTQQRRQEIKKKCRKADFIWGLHLVNGGTVTQISTVMHDLAAFLLEAHCSCAVKSVLLLSVLCWMGKWSDKNIEDPFTDSKLYRWLYKHVLNSCYAPMLISNRLGG